MSVESRLGVSVPVMRKLAKEIGRDHRLAQSLWKTGIAEAQIVAALIDDPAAVTSSQMDRWVKDFDSWDVCDQACLSLFDKSPLAWQRIPVWAKREEEFVKRAAFALLAGLAWHDKQAADSRFVDLFPILIKGADDDRNYVKKAVSWAIRNIGKRNRTLNKAARKLARDIRRMDSKAARWVAADALRELQSEAVQRRLSK
jgi:3-methyladenine DNA glycosylase AlkD